MKKLVSLLCVFTIMLPLSLYAETNSKKSVGNEKIAELAASFFDGFALELTNITVSGENDSSATIIADTQLSMPNYSYQSYLSYLDSLYHTLSDSPYDFEFNIRMKYKDFPDPEAASYTAVMLGVEENFIGQKYLDYAPGNDKSDMTMKDSLFVMTETFKDGTTRDTQLTGTIGSLSSLNCYMAGEKANFLELFQKEQPMFADFKSEFPKTSLMLRHTQKIKDLQSITIRFDTEKNIQMMKAWNRNPDLSDKALAVMADLGEDFTSQEAVSARVIEKLKTRASRPDAFMILAIFNIPITFLIGLIVFAVKKQRRYKNISKNQEPFETGARKSDTSRYVTASMVIFLILYTLGLIGHGVIYSKINNYSREEVYALYENEAQRFSGQALDSILQSGGSIDATKNTIAEHIPYEDFTDEAADLYRKPLASVPRAGIVGGIIILIYVTLNLFLYLKFSKAPESIIAIRKQCLGSDGKFGEIVRIMIQCSKNRQLPTYYNIISTYQNGGLVSTRKEADAGMNLLTAATFKVIIPVCIVVVSAYIAAFWGIVLALDAKYRNFDRPDMEYRYWVDRLNQVR